MENLDNLYQWLREEGVCLFDRQLPFSQDSSKAVTIRLNGHDTWGIFIDTGRMDTRTEEKAAMLHECGHYATGTTHEVSSPYDLVEKHEYKADKWAVQKALTAEELDDAVAEGHTDIWDLAEHFGVTEEFMRKAVCWYVHGNLAVEAYMNF